MLHITPYYALPLTLLFVLLSLNVVRGRISEKVSLGDGGNAMMLRRIRAQANCAEYAPLGIVLLAMAELAGRGAGWLHLVGICLLLGRMLHAAQLSFQGKPFLLRQAGMILTFTALILAAVLALPM